MLNKKLLSFTLGAAVVSTSMLSPKQASASYLWDEYNGSCDSLCEGLYLITSGWLAMTIIGIVLLPVMLLDQQNIQTAAVSEKDLEQNGYTTEQINTIIADQKKIFTAMEQKAIDPKITPKNNDELVQLIQSIEPNVSQDYLDFVQNFR